MADDRQIPILHRHHHGRSLIANAHALTGHTTRACDGEICISNRQHAGSTVDHHAMVIGQ